MAMNRAWSKQIERHYRFQLPPDLVSWFDDGIWRNPGQSEFRYPLAPEQFIEPPEGTIWAGFMLPDTLPLVGNQYGDWLCMRIAPEGRVAEILCWNHGGGDWIPYGQSLPEALLYDAYAAYQRGEASHGERLTIGDRTCNTIQWACDWIARTALKLSRPLNEQLLAQPTARDRLLGAGVAEIVIRRDRILESLDSPLKSCSDPEIAQHMDVVWDPEFIRWIFDTDLVPLAARGDLSRLFDLPLDSLLSQDWASAEREAHAVIRLRQDLGWPFDIAGWAAERRGEIRQAIGLYAQGVQTSLFADECVRFRTHWFPEGLGKFAAARLDHWRSQLPSALRDNRYLHLFWENDPESLRTRLRLYWLEQARQHFQSSQYMHAFHCYYRAGWDYGSSDLDTYAEILDGIDASATASGSTALANVVRTHRRVLSA
jgi:hypothetical protein